MPLPEKTYLSLPEVAEKWQCPVEDIEHHIETGRLTAYVIWDGGLLETGNTELRELPSTSLRKFKRGQRYGGPQIERYEEVCITREECSRFEREHSIDPVHKPDKRQADKP